MVCFGRKAQLLARGGKSFDQDPIIYPGPVFGGQVKRRKPPEVVQAASARVASTKTTGFRSDIVLRRRHFPTISSDSTEALALPLSDQGIP